ncbi:MAG: PEP-CTERM sorting domain-containing protein [Thermoguttaceae bacterium]|jgi:hypothetical protein
MFGKTTVRGLLAVALAAALGLAAAGTAYADPVAEYGYSGSLGSGGDYTVGWSFTTNQAISVTALDALYPAPGGSQVYLYGTSDNVLASTTVLTTDPREGSPIPFYSQAITPVVLAAGQTYYIVENMTPGSSVAIYAYGVTTQSFITYGGGVAEPGLSTYPTTDAFYANYLNWYAPDYFGPNFDATAVESVPEPSVAMGLCTSLLGLAVIYLRRRGARA